MSKQEIEQAEREYAAMYDCLLQESAIHYPHKDFAKALDEYFESEPVNSPRAGRFAFHQYMTHRPRNKSIGDPDFTRDDYM